MFWPKNYTIYKFLTINMTTCPNLTLMNNTHVLWTQINQKSTLIIGDWSFQLNVCKTIARGKPHLCNWIFLTQNLSRPGLSCIGYVFSNLKTAEIQLHVQSFLKSISGVMKLVTLVSLDNLNRSLILAVQLSVWLYPQVCIYMNNTYSYSVFI